jgi:hypothetical protein
MIEFNYTRYYNGESKLVVVQNEKEKQGRGLSHGMDAGQATTANVVEQPNEVKKQKEEVVEPDQGLLKQLLAMGYNA